MAYIFQRESRIEIEVGPDNEIAIFDYEDEDSGHGEVRIVVFSHQRLPLIIAALQEIQADLAAGKYDITSTPEA